MTDRYYDWVGYAYEAYLEQQTLEYESWVREQEQAAYDELEEDEPDTES